ncbi:hypothetical protein CC80DRAFT_541558 [Byssothecium circinans]|uniref:Uncharacterized protein n=1 Tax=Byssothecium circinans TaxID=147558 RepID=A0A6A5UFF5_9PLEO|nr:hypothetical protein CC80DRAFT_541558 [Byssothecium circinans]
MALRTLPSDNWCICHASGALDCAKKCITALEKYQNNELNFRGAEFSIYGLGDDAEFKFLKYFMKGKNCNISALLKLVEDLNIKRNEAWLVSHVAYKVIHWDSWNQMWKDAIKPIGTREEFAHACMKSIKNNRFDHLRCPLPTDAKNSLKIVKKMDVGQGPFFQEGDRIAFDLERSVLEYVVQGYSAKLITNTLVEWEELNDTNLKSIIKPFMDYFEPPNESQLVDHLVWRVQNWNPVTWL